jgi:hypothetical protein
MGRLGMVVSTRVVWSGSVIIVLEVDVRTFLEHDSDKFAVFLSRSRNAWRVPSSS